MAKTASPFDVDFEANAKRIRELNDKVLTAVKQTGTISLDNYEQTVHSHQDFGVKVADSIRPELISEIVKVHLSTINKVTNAYTQAARELLK